MTNLTNDSLPEVIGVVANLTGNPRFREMGQEFQQLVEFTEQSNHDLGHNQEILLHNASDDSILKSILENGLCSRREAIKKGIKIQFQQGSNRGRVFMDNSGITLESDHYSWNEVQGNVQHIRDAMTKHWAEEFDQVLFSGEATGNGTYYDGDWAIALPAREMRMNYQFSNHHDGIHVFNPDYDQQTNERDLHTDTFHPETNGCRIDLNQHNFLVPMTEGALNRFREYFENNFDKLPNPHQVKTAEEWMALYVVKVDDFHSREDAMGQPKRVLDTVRKEMFSRFDVEEKDGTKVDSGNKSQMAGDRFTTYLYI